MLTEQQIEALRTIQAAIERAMRLVGVANAQVETAGIEGLPVVSGQALAMYYHEQVGKRLELHRMEVNKFRQQSAISRKAAA